MKKRVEIDTGKGTDGLFTFDLEKEIKKYEKGIDYTVDSTNNYYTVISEKLKSIIWPNDHYPYDESIVFIDRQGKVQSMRVVGSKESPTEPYKQYNEGGFKEVEKDIDKVEFPRLNDKKKSGGSLKYYTCQGDIVDSSKESKIPWIVGSLLLFSIPLSFFLVKKTILCWRKKRKS